MFTSHPSLLVLLSLLLVLSPSVHVKGQQDSSVKCEPLLPELVRKTKTGVVTIHIYDDDGGVVGQSSGWFITPRVIVSTRHSFWKKGLEDASYAKVETNCVYGLHEPRQYLVQSVLVDSESLDLVLLEVVPASAPSAGINGPSWTSQTVLEVATGPVLEGESIYVISTPLGLPGVVSSGIVAAIHNEYDLQITAEISTGSSGAPIFNYKGEVVGIVSGHLTQGQNVNFGLTITALSALIAQLRPTMEYVARLPSDGPSHPDTKSAEKGIEGGMRGDSTELSLWEGEVVMRRGGWETNHFKAIARAVAAASKAHPSSYSFPQSAYDFAASLRELKASTLRAICYPSLHDWASRLSARAEEEARRAEEEKMRQQKWYANWKQFTSEVQSMFGKKTNGGSGGERVGGGGSDEGAALAEPVLDDMVWEWKVEGGDVFESIDPLARDFQPSFEEPFSVQLFQNNLFTLKTCLPPDPFPWNDSTSQVIPFIETTPPIITNPSPSSPEVLPSSSSSSSPLSPLSTLPIQQVRLASPSSSSPLSRVLPTSPPFRPHPSPIPLSSSLPPSHPPLYSSTPVPPSSSPPLSSSSPPAPMDTSSVASSSSSFRDVPFSRTTPIPPVPPSPPFNDDAMSTVQLDLGYYDYYNKEKEGEEEEEGVLDEDGDYADFEDLDAI